VSGLKTTEIFFFLYIQSTRDHEQSSAIAILHTLKFTVTDSLEVSVFTSPILATDLEESVTSNHTRSLSAIVQFVISSQSLQTYEADTFL
jgi:hypothetical protein